MLFLVSRSPTFVPDMATRVLFAVPSTGVVRQLSNAGRGSPISAPLFKPAAIAPSGFPGVFPSAAKGCSVAQQVLPEIKLTAPTDDGPKFVPKELSLIEKCCA